MKEAIRCFCENQIEFEFSDMVVLSDEVIESILCGDFMSVTCTFCGRVLKPEFPVHLESKDNKYSLFFIPENKRNQYLAGNISVHPAITRVVIGYHELVEKITIFKNNLDDRVIETIKYYFLEKAREEVTISIFLHEIGKSDLVFHIHGLKQKEIGITKINRSLYEKISKEIDKKEGQSPYSQFLSPPYVSIQNITLEG